MKTKTVTLLKTKQAAAILNCHTQTIYALGRRGVLTEIVIGTMHRWRADEVDALVRGVPTLAAGSAPRQSQTPSA